MHRWTPLAGSVQSMLALAVAFVLVLVGAAPGSAMADSDLSERFLKEAPKQWAEYEQRLRHCGIMLRYNSTNTITRSVESCQVEYKQNEICALWKEHWHRSEEEGKTWREHSVSAYNSRYAFQLSRSGSGESWLLRFCEPRSSNRHDDAIESYIDRQAKVIYRLIQLPASLKLNDLVRDPDFRLIRCEPVAYQGTEAVHLEFTSHSSGSHPLDAHKGTNVVEVTKGTMLLDPRRFWCLLGFRVEMIIHGQRSTVRGLCFTEDVDVRQTEAGTPFAANMVVRQEWRSTDGHTNNRWERFRFRLNEVDPLPPEQDFTLSAFGLPEPPGVEWKDPIPPVYCAIAIGIGLIVVGVGVFGYFRRRAAKAA